MVHVIPLSIAQRRLDTGNAPQYPQGSPVGGAMQGLGDRLSAVAEHHRRMTEQQEAFDAELARRRFNGQVAQVEDEVTANARPDGAGLHEAMYGQMDLRNGRVVKTGLFDKLFDTALPGMPESQRASFANQKEALRAAGSLRMAARQLQRRQDYEQAQVDTALKTSAIAIGNANPDDHMIFEAARQEGLDLIDKMGVDPGIRQQKVKDWFSTAAKARFEALIARDPKRALAMFGVGAHEQPSVDNVTSDTPRPLGGSGAAAAKGDGTGRHTPDERAAQDFRNDIAPEDQSALIQKARTADTAQRLEVRANIGMAEQNAPAAIRDTGTYSGPTPTPEQFVALYGATEGVRRFKAFNQAITVSRQFYAMRGMSNDAVRAMIGDAAPKEDSANPEADGARHDAVATAADLTFRARQGDPGGYVRKTFASLDAAWNNLSKPEDYQAAIIGSIAAQQQLGFETVQPLPNSVAESVVDRLKAAKQPQDEDQTLSSIFATLPTLSARKAMLGHLLQTDASQTERSIADRARREVIVDPNMLLDLRKAVESGLLDPNVEVTNYIPTLQDRLGRLVAGDSKPGSVRRKLARGLVGSEGSGEEGSSLADFTPVGLIFSADKAGTSARYGNYGDMLLNVAGAVPAEQIASVGMKQAGKIVGLLGKELSHALKPGEMAEGAEALVRGSDGTLAKSAGDGFPEGQNLYEGVNDLSKRPPDLVAAGRVAEHVLGTPADVAARTNVSADLPFGSFSISDWTGYPAVIPKPEGPFRLLENAEYSAARDAANKANRTIRREQGLVGQSVDVHEINPVKFGGSPIDSSNKIVLPRDVHRQQATPWWNQLLKDLGG